LTHWGTWLAVRHFKKAPRASAIGSLGKTDFQPISILKPVKGTEESLTENLESFFRLIYPKYEILFSVADATDPCIPVIEILRAKYPRVRSRLIVGDVNVGPNPKVNNLVRSYAQARHDWLLISDSNVRVEPDYLYIAAAPFTPEVGIVTAAVSGSAPSASGGWLESVFLNTFYARWMLIARHTGNPVVVGKSMLFRKSEAERFGGIVTLGRYLAEDYMAGQAMALLNLRVEIMRQPIMQPIGNYSFKAFWSRHIRWGRIRKSQAPALFFFEPLFSFWLSGIAAAISLAHFFGFSWVVTLSVHGLLWLVSDLLIMRSMKGRVCLKAIFAWLIRETLSVPLWFHISLGKTVMWRGRELTLSRGGLLRL
jgi:ceramide glucosyltransferase